MRVNISIKKTDLKIIDDFCKEEGVTRSECIREVLISYIKREQEIKKLNENKFEA